MSELNEHLSGDSEMRTQLAASIRRYVKRRDALERLAATGHPGGGPERVKCLHAHTAHQLVTEDNPVGKAVLQELSWTDPDQPCV